MKTDAQFTGTKGFSLVEVLAAVAVIGIITFLAIPNIVRVKTDSENSLALSRAASLNMAMASYARAQGGNTAPTAWTAADNATRYTYLAPYLAFAPASFTDYQPGGYTLTIPAALNQSVSVSYPGETNGNHTVY